MAQLARLAALPIVVATLTFTTPTLQHVTAQGQTPQVYRFHGGGYDRAGAITVDAAGNFYIAGSADAARERPTFAAQSSTGTGI